MRESVRQAWSRVVEGQEGCTTWMYLDTKGLVTVGKGNLIDSDAPGDHADQALGLPWLRPDGTLASEDEIRAEWHRVKCMVPGQVARRYWIAGGLSLSPAAVDDLVEQRLGDFWAGLVRMFPAAEDWPASVQLGALLMAWALGLGRLRRLFPHFCAALVAGDWVRAAAESEISGARPARNMLHRDLFLAAAAGDDPDALPEGLV